MIEVTMVQTQGKEDNTSEVMVQLGMFEHRVVHSTKAHPQVGWINYEGQRQKVYVGFWGDCPVWKLAYGDDDPEYLYCAKRTIEIEDDSDYCGEENEVELIEQLAAKEHESWAHWMKYLFSVCQQEADGSVHIPFGLAEHWKQQAAMPYEALSEREKQSDRNRVEKIIPIIDNFKGQSIRNKL